MQVMEGDASSTLISWQSAHNSDHYFYFKATLARVLSMPSMDEKSAAPPTIGSSPRNRAYTWSYRARSAADREGREASSA